MQEEGSWRGRRSREAERHAYLPTVRRLTPVSLATCATEYPSAISRRTSAAVEGIGIGTGTTQRMHGIAQTMGASRPSQRIEIARFSPLRMGPARRSDRSEIGVPLRRGRAPWGV